MALSDWATVAFNEKGNPTRGILKGFNKTQVEIYKDWVYVSNPDMWVESVGYSKNTIAQITDGHVNIGGVDIVAHREPEQDAVFVYAKTLKYNTNPDIKPEIKIMAGIGCSGYSNTVIPLAKHFKVNLDEWESHCTGCSNYYENEKGEHVTDEKGAKYISLVLFNKKDSKEFFVRLTPRNEKKFEAKWIGVTPKLYRKFLKWLGEQVKEEYDKRFQQWYRDIKNKKLDDVLNYNQGDAFFADNGVMDNIGAKIGKPVPPLMETLIERMKVENKESIS
jgi:hypothetical protein